jgi:hypothetical protein
MRVRWAAVPIFFLLPALFGGRPDGPSSPMRDFFLPFHGRDGEKVWDARGSDAEIYVDSRRILVRNLYVRLFDGHGEGTLKLVLESPFAEFDGAENRITGDDFIHVVGNLFTAIGGRWTFFGEDHSMILERDVQVFFETNVAQILSDDATKGGGFTCVTGDSLQITDCAHGFSLDFLQSVAVRADDFILTCDTLHVETLAVDPIVILEQRVGQESVRSIRAEGNVTVEGSGQVIHATVAELFPEEGVAILSGDVAVVDGDAPLKGRRVVLRHGESRVLVDAGADSRDVVGFEFD